MSTRLVRCAGVARRAFTLIELMVVMLIIAVIIAIVLPALKGVRNASKTSATRAMMTGITNAVSSFVNSERRLPGYFTARQMGDAGNETTRGFAAMQNAMLELAPGGVVADGTQPMPQTGDVLVGPGTTPAGQAWVRPDMMGVGGNSTAKAYYVPDAKFWVAQNAGNQQVGAPENQNLKSVVDHFGNPFLVWSQDDTAVGQIVQVDQFAKQNVTGNAASARFYWASNACFLGAGGLGQRSYDQTDPASGSMIGGTNPPANIGDSLCGLLGNPSFPYRAPSATAAPTVPAAPRGQLILHSAGVDGIFMGKKDRGAKQFAAGFLDYQLNFVNTPGGSETNAGQIYTDKDGKREILDIIAKFDDLLASAGN